METEPRKLLGDAVRLRRVRMGLTQEEVAKRTDCSHAWISRLENAKLHRPDMPTLTKLAQVLNTEPTEWYKLLGYRLPSVTKSDPQLDQGLSDIFFRVQKLPPEKRDTIVAGMGSMLQLAEGFNERKAKEKP